jgi:hypothetical protein
MDVKEAGSKGGKSAWAKLTKKQRSAIMTERQRKRWKKTKAAAKAAKKRKEQ